MEMTEEVKKYRQEHPRCRTCDHACQVNRYEWECYAKREVHSGVLRETKFAGCFCNLYKPNLLG